MSETVTAPPLLWEGQVPLQQVLDHVRPAYGGDTWSDAFATLLNSPGDVDTIEALKVSGADGFREPIRVDYDDEDGCWRVGNGMHRITAAVQMGHTHIRCSTGYPNEGENTEYVEVVYRITGYDGETDGVGDDMGFAVEWLRSFPLPDGTWVESDLCSSMRGALEGLWRCPHTHAEALLAEMARRATGFQMVAWRSVTQSELDAEYAAEFGDH